MASGSGHAHSSPPPTIPDEIEPATPQSSQEPPTASNEAPITLPDTLTGVSLPEFYTSPIPIPPEITPIRTVAVTESVTEAVTESVTESVTASDSPEPVNPPKKTRISYV